MAKALGISQAPDRARFLGELVRVLWDTPEGKNDLTDARLARLTTYAQAVGRLQVWLDASHANDSGFSLAMGQTRDRARLDEFLAAASLRLRGREPLRVEVATDKGAAERTRQLADVGVDVAAIADQLNAGRQVRIALTEETVPIPLGARTWSDVVFRRPVSAASLFMAIVSDRRAALLSLGLAALDDETLGFFAGNATALQRLYAEHAAPFAAFGEALRIRGGRVVPAGGADGLAAWEAALGAKASDPDRFIDALFRAQHGRTALVYAALAHLDAPHVRFATGAWLKDPRARIDQFKSLVAAVGVHGDWEVGERPFARPVWDVATLLTRVRVEADGRPAPPFARAFWRGAFDGSDIPGDPARLLRHGNDDGTIDAGWLAQNVCVSDPRARSERMDQLSFAQRAFAAVDADALPDALVAVRALPRFRMLVLTLERLGIRNPRVYAAGARHASALTSLSGRRAFVAFGQVQGALAVLARLGRVHRLPPQALESLAASLFATPYESGYRGGIARWIDQDLRTALQIAADADVDEELVRALAGVEAAPETLPRIAWEGLSYRLDFVGPERSRLTRAREMMAAPSIGAAIELSKTAAAPTVEVLRRLAPMMPASDRKNAVAPPDVEPPPNAPAVVERAIGDLTKAGASNPPRPSDPLATLAEDLLAQALMSLAYAIDIGDPEGTTLLGGDPSRRHDFGILNGPGDTRVRAAWSEPRDVTAEGARHVSGSLVGLDVGLGAFALRRVNAGSLPPAPTLSMPERQEFITTFALMNPRDLADADRDAIVAAIGRGRSALSAVTADPSRWDAAADRMGIDGWRRRAVRWTLAHDASQLPSFVSLAELAVLGAPDGGLPPLDRFGMAGLAREACLCTIAPAPGLLPLMTGRPRVGLIAAQMADLNLRVAERLSAAKLPASLEPAILAAGVQDFVDRVTPLHADDWLTLVRAAQAVPDERIDDYVASLTTGGPLVLDRPGTVSSNKEQVTSLK